MTSNLTSPHFTLPFPGRRYFGEPKGITTDATTGERVGYNNMIYSGG